MPPLTTNHHTRPRNLHGGKFADMLNDSKTPSVAVLDISICGDRQPPMQDSETDHERIPLAKLVRECESLTPVDALLSSNHPHGTKQSRQAVGVVARLGMEKHGWKQTGKKSSLWTFEHRWAHLRDRAEGRNHRLSSK